MGNERLPFPGPSFGMDLANSSCLWLLEAVPGGPVRQPCGESVPLVLAARDTGWGWAEWAYKHWTELSQ